MLTILQKQKRRNSHVYVKSSHRRYSLKKGVLKNFANFKGKQLCWSLYLMKLQTWRPAALLKRDSNTDIFCQICEIFEERLETTVSKLLFREKTVPKDRRSRLKLFYEIDVFKIFQNLKETTMSGSRFQKSSAPQGD